MFNLEWTIVDVPVIIQSFLIVHRYLRPNMTKKLVKKLEHVFIAVNAVISATDRYSSLVATEDAHMLHSLHSSILLKLWFTWNRYIVHNRIVY